MNETRQTENSKKEKERKDLLIGFQSTAPDIIRQLCWARLIPASLKESPLARGSISLLLRREGIDFFFHPC